MKKALTLLLILLFAGGCFTCAFADDDWDDDDDDDDYRHRHHYSARYDYDDDDDDDYDDDDDRYRNRRHYRAYRGWDEDRDYRYWREHGNYDRLRARRYRDWYRQCNIYGGIGCSYSRWNKYEKWDRNDWDNYWKKNRPQEYERAHRKMRAIDNAINATREIFLIH